MQSVNDLAAELGKPPVTVRWYCLRLRVPKVGRDYVITPTWARRIIAAMAAAKPGPKGPRRG